MGVLWGRRCICDYLFKHFRWVNLATVSDKDLPNEPGVYVLRLVYSDNDVDEVRRGVLRSYSIGIEILRRAKWARLSRYWGPRIERIRRIDPSQCPVLYIGCSGKGSGTIRTRFRDLAGLRHTIFPCIFVLRLADIDIAFGFITFSNGAKAFEQEKRILREYRGLHGRLPPLNEAA